MLAMTIKHARELAGNVSTSNSKMPGSSFPTDPFACHVGSKLAEVPGSVCSKCYARKLAKFRTNVGQGWAKNQIAIDTNDRAGWIAGAVRQIEAAAERTGEPFHRWFDAGDLASADNLARIAAVCRQTPAIRHWLPTREIGIVRDYVRGGGTIPRNLVIRISSTMIGDAPRSVRSVHVALRTSTVHRHGEASTGHVCPASRTDAAGKVWEPEAMASLSALARRAADFGHCGNCRACWSRSTANTSYPLH